MRCFTVLCVCLTLAVICSSTEARKLSKKDSKVKTLELEEDENDGPPKIPDPSKVQEPEEGSAEEEGEESGPTLNKEDVEKLKKKLREKLLAPSSVMKSRKRVELDKDKKKAYDTMKQIMVRVLLISKVALAGAPVGHLVGIFIALLDTSVSAEGNVWDQIKDQVDAKISEAISRYHFDKTQGHFMKFQTMAKIKQNNFNIDDLVDILAAKHDMLPYNYRDVGYSEEMATLLPTWTLFMTTAYLQLITNGEIKDRCALAKEMATLRKDTIKTAKSLFRKRYKKIDGTGSEKRRPDYGCTGMVCFFAYHLTYTDRFNDEKHEKLISKAEEVFRRIQREVVASLMRILIEPINEFFREGICLEGCEVPAPITESEITFEYPRACYGQATGDNPGQCTLPCATYSESYTWCPYYPGKYAHDYSNNNNKIGSNWDYCKKADWNTCMVV